MEIELWVSVLYSPFSSPHYFPPDDVLEHNHLVNKHTMKKSLSFLIALIGVSTLFAFNGTPTETTPVLIANPQNTSFTVQNIFFSDYDNAILFIDFQALPGEIVNVKILKEEVLMMEDEVTDLPLNTIYEINLDIIREGKYTVELVTAEGIVVHKEIWVE